VLPDNEGGACRLAHALFELGHRHYGVISGPRLLTSSRDRLGGFVRGLQECGVNLPDDAVIASDFTREGGAAAALALLRRYPMITALFALNDVMAIGALSMLRAHGIAVPGEISVAGYDDIPIASDVFPPLATVRVPMQALGARALTQALASDATPYSTCLPTEVVLRASASAPTRAGNLARLALEPA
jgi:LacI family transcriptional regulator